MNGKQVNGRLQNTITALLTDRPIAYHPVIAKAVKSVTAGVFLSQFLYWTPRTRDPHGWIYKTQTDIYAETALTRREQETARRILRDNGVLEEKKAGVPCRLYFRVNMQALVSLLGDDAPSFPQDGGNGHPGMAETDCPGCPKAPNKDGQSVQALNKKTENTIQENTTETRDTSPRPTDEHLPPPHAVGQAQLEEGSAHQEQWTQVLEQAKKDLPLGESEARLTGTALLEITETAARIRVNNPTALAWLERRMYRQICKALKGVIGKDLDLQFVSW